MLDQTNLMTEYEKMVIHCRHSINTINDFSNFLKASVRTGEQQHLQTKFASEKMFSDLLRTDSKSTLSKYIFSFYRNFEAYNTKYQNFYSRIDSEIIQPVTLFSKDFEDHFSEALHKFKQLANLVIDRKLLVERSKNKYFEACRAVQEQEKVFLRQQELSESTATPASDNKLRMIHDQLIKLKIMAENLCHAYKIEVELANEEYSKLELSYKIIVSEIRNAEERRLLFYKCHLEKYTILHEELANLIQEYLGRMQNSLVEIDIERDISTFDEKFTKPFLVNNTDRISKEEFVNYEIYKRNIEEALNQSKSKDFGHQHTPSNDSSNNLLLGSTEDRDSMISEVKSTETDINSFLQVIYTKSSADSTLKETLSKKIEPSQKKNKDEIFRLAPIEYTERLIDSILIKAKSTSTLDFLNEENFLFFGELLAKALININGNSDGYFEMYYAVLFLSSKSRYFKRETLTSYYLSSIVAMNVSKKSSLVKKIEFWKKLIIYKLDKKNSVSEANIQSKYRDQIGSKTNKTYYASTTNMLFSLGSKVKNLLGTSEGKKIELDATHQKLLKTEQTKNLVSVLKEFIPHMNFYGLNIDDEISLVYDIYSTYSYLISYSTKDDLINDEIKSKVEYLKAYIYSNNHSAKKTLLSSHLGPDNFGYSNPLSSNNPRQSIKKSVYANINYLLMQGDITKNQFLVLSCLPFLNNEDSVPALVLNKSLKKHVLKELASRALSTKNSYFDDDIELGQRLKIWRSLLKTNQLKSEYNYRSLLEELLSMKKDFSHIPSLQKNYETLLLDVRRTFFKNNLETNRKVLENIILVILFVNPAICYCQGMNYIGAFIIEITEDEEQAFYLMLGLFLNTNYCELYFKDLYKLKFLFQLFEKALNLKLYECFHHLSVAGITSNYYVSPWFITLFTITLPNIVDNDNPKFILRIWDNFILNGWHAIVSMGLILIKNYSENIVTLKFEDLLNLLINDIVRTGLIQNVNCQKLLAQVEQIDFSIESFKTLENLCLLEEKETLNSKLK